MVLSAEQERVRSLIADTVSLLCKNGLHYTKEFSIEGLLGITLDHDEVFLVNIKEIVKTEMSKDYLESGSGSEESTNPNPSSRRRRRKRQRKNTGDGVESDSDNEMNSSVHGGRDNSSKKNIKLEDNDSGDDLVFVKNEPGLNHSNNFSSNFSGLSGATSATNDILGDLSQQGQLYATPTSNPLPSPSWDPHHSTNSLYNTPNHQQAMNVMSPTASPGGSMQHMGQQQEAERRRTDPCTGGGGSNTVPLLTILTNEWPGVDVDSHIKQAFAHFSSHSKSQQASPSDPAAKDHQSDPTSSEARKEKGHTETDLLVQESAQHHKVDKKSSVSKSTYKLPQQQLPVHISPLPAAPLLEPWKAELKEKLIENASTSHTKKDRERKSSEATTSALTQIKTPVLEQQHLPLHISSFPHAPLLQPWKTEKETDTERETDLIADKKRSTAKTTSSTAKTTLAAPTQRLPVHVSPLPAAPLLEPWKTERQNKLSAAKDKKTK